MHKSAHTPIYKFAPMPIHAYTHTRIHAYTHRHACMHVCTHDGGYHD